jgi:alanine racemase
MTRKSLKMSLNWIEISKSALTHNLRQFRKIAGSAKIMAMVKSNAYGHGIDLVSEAIQKDVDWFGTVNLEEAIQLRDLGISKPILVLSYYDDDHIDEALRKNISLVVFDIRQIAKINTSAEKLNLKGRIHVKIDTGTTRLGIMPEEALDFIRELTKYPYVELEGIFSHLATAEDNTKYTGRQLKIFNDLTLQLLEEGLDIRIKHIACTASAVAFGVSRYDLIRLGIGLYGLSSFKAYAKDKKTVLPDLRPALSWKTKIVQIKKVPKNTFVGYSLTYKTPKASVLAVLPVGYNEGYDRKFSNNSVVLVHGIKCPVRGRVCMNLIIIDVSKVKDAKVGDEAVLIGSQEGEKISADDLAERIDTINYEIVARLNPNIPRVLVP